MRLTFQDFLCEVTWGKYVGTTSTGLSVRISMHTNGVRGGQLKPRNSEMGSELIMSTVNKHKLDLVSGEHITLRTFANGIYHVLAIQRMLNTLRIKTIISSAKKPYKNRKDIIDL